MHFRYIQNIQKKGAEIYNINTKLVQIYKKYTKNGADIYKLEKCNTKYGRYFYCTAATSSEYFREQIPTHF